MYVQTYFMMTKLDPASVPCHDCRPKRLLLLTGLRDGATSEQDGRAFLITIHTARRFIASPATAVRASRRCRGASINSLRKPLRRALI